MKTKIYYCIALMLLCTSYWTFGQKAGHTVNGGGGQSASPKPTHSESRPTYSQPTPQPRQVESRPTYSQPAPQPRQVESRPTYSQPAPQPRQVESRPTYSQPSYNESRPTYSQPAPQPRQVESRPTYSQPSYTESRPTYSQPAPQPKPSYTETRPTYNQPKPARTETRPINTYPSVDPRPTASPKPTYSTSPTGDSRPTYTTGYEASGVRPTTSLAGNAGEGTVRPRQAIDPRVESFSGISQSETPSTRPSTRPNTLSGATVAGGDDEPQENPGGIGNDNRFVTVCVDGNSISVPASQLQSYLGSGAVSGPCNTGNPVGPIGHVNPVGAGGIDPAGPVDTHGPVHNNGNGTPVGSVGDPADPHDVVNSGNGGHGHGHNSGGVWTGQGAQGGYNTGTNCTPGYTNYGYGGGYYSGYVGTGCNGCSDTWYAGNGCGHSHYGGFCGSCSGNNYYYTSNYLNNCQSYYGYGYYYPASYNVGYCYTGLYSGVSYTLIYPWVAKDYKVSSFVPNENRRVVILDSKNGRKHWRIVEERAWMPERIIWDNGVQRTQEGYYTWKVVSKTKYRHKRRNCKICAPQTVR